MVTGKKKGVPEDAIRSAHPFLGLGLLLVAAAWCAALFANHDVRSASVKLPVIGVSMQLGENESEENEQARGERRKDHRDDDDD